MVGYYHTANDESFAKRVLKKYEGRLEYDPAAKRGQHWRLDGNVIGWKELSEKLARYGRKLNKKEGDRYHKAVWKVSNLASAPSTLALLRKKLLSKGKEE